MEEGNLEEAKETYEVIKNIQNLFLTLSDDLRHKQNKFSKAL